MRAQVTYEARLDARPVDGCSLAARPLNARALAAWRACACAIDRNFVVIRLKYPAV